ncbi:DNA modification methylase [Novosphingobium aquae]|uniref:Methyltransferase n=1 Tax=Novosphingobium aquae TaxID=3133435 RepID=A0ABU8S5X9_9SPHN
MSFKINKLKKPLLEKTAAQRKELRDRVSQAAIAASIPNDLLPKINLEKRQISSLKSRTARKASNLQLERVMRSLRQHRQSAPIIISTAGRIVDGHIVVKALQKLGEKEVWCVVIDHLDEAQQDLLHISLNRLAETGEWDLDALGEMLIELDELEFDLQVTGFTEPELDILMTPELSADGKQDPEEVDPPEVSVSEVGDIWQLGGHFLLCGDALQVESYNRLMGSDLAQAIFTDCPWNIPIAGFVSGLGKVKHDDFVMAAGEMSDQEFANFCEVFTAHCASVLADGGVFYSCIDWRSVDKVMASGRKAGLKHIMTAVWNKGSGGMGGLYRSAHEFIPVFCKGNTPSVNNVALGKHGRDRSSVWSYPGANKRGSSSADALQYHPTGKPIELVADALLDVTKKGDLVLDPFLGSGTTMLASERSGRRCRAIELDPRYVDVSLKRWELMTGQTAIHVESGLNYEQLGEQRLGAGSGLITDQPKFDGE